MYEEIENLSEEQLIELYDGILESDSLISWCKCNTVNNGCLYVPYIQSNSECPYRNNTTFGCYTSQYGYIEFEVVNGINGTCAAQANGLEAALATGGYLRRSAGGVNYSNPSCGWCNT